MTDLNTFQLQKGMDTDMKLVLAIVSNDDSRNIVPQLTESGYWVTTMPSVGGFLRAGSVTLMIVTAEERIEELKKLISKCCSKRKSVFASTDSLGKGLRADGLCEEVTTGGATFFVLDVDRFERF